MDAEAGERAAQEATQLLREENMAVRAQLEVPDPPFPPDPPCETMAMGRGGREA